MQTLRAVQNNPKDRLFQIAIIAIIALGIILRASKYLPAWSMRGDELAIIQNITARSAIELMIKPLDYEQAAPFGFLLLTKALITGLGGSEYVWRLPAFMAGCVSLILIHILLTKTGSRYGNMFALAALAVGNYPIFYSAELKQYSTDVLMCLILLLAFYQHLSKETSTKDFIVLGALGALALCLSYPAIFVIAAIGMTLFLHYWKDRQRLLWTILTGIVWAGTFLALYFVLLRHQTQDAYLITFWDNLLSFMPVPPWSDLTWFPKALTGLSYVVAGLPSSLILVIPVYVLGLWGFLKEKKWQWVLALTIPIGLNLIASGFQKYPFHGRLILYVLPLLFVMLAKGMDVIINLIRNRVVANAAFAGLLILLLQQAVPTTTSYLYTRSYLRDDLKPVLSFVEDNKQDSDLVYLYHFIEQQYTYYAPSYNLEDLSYRTGENNAGNAGKYQAELSTLPRGRRIWFIFSFVIEARVRKGEKQDERVYILNYLKENGTRLDEYYSANDASSAHLFILK